MSKRARLFVISAPSGAGKTTLCEKLLQSLPDLTRSISMTTRTMRPGEKNGQDYVFVSREAFKKKIKEKRFLEYAKVFENYYGTPRKFVEDNLARNKDVVLNIDVQGAMKIRRKFRRSSVFIFIVPPSLEVLKSRLEKRETDSAAEINRRLQVAKKELEYLKYYDYEIVNDDLKTAFDKLLAVVIAARCEVGKDKK